MDIPDDIKRAIDVLAEDGDKENLSPGDAKVLAAELYLLGAALADLRRVADGVLRLPRRN